MDSLTFLFLGIDAINLKAINSEPSLEFFTSERVSKRFIPIIDIWFWNLLYHLISPESHMYTIHNWDFSIQYLPLPQLLNAWLCGILFSSGPKGLNHLARFSRIFYLDFWIRITTHRLNCSWIHDRKDAGLVYHEYKIIDSLGNINYWPDLRIISTLVLSNQNRGNFLRLY